MQTEDTENRSFLKKSSHTDDIQKLCLQCCCVERERLENEGQFLFFLLVEIDCFSFTGTLCNVCH